MPLNLLRNGCWQTDCFLIAKNPPKHAEKNIITV